MKNGSNARLLICAVLLIPALCTGCLKGELLLEIDKHGSGSLEASYSITENAVAQLKSMVDLAHRLEDMSLGKSKAPEPDPGILLFLDPDEQKIRAELAKYEKSGLKLDKLRVRSRNARRSVDLRLKFNDIIDVARADFFADIGFSLYRRKSGDLVFFRKSMNENNPQKGVLADESAQRLIAPILEGFMITVKIHPPGRILESNATSAGLNSATWVFDQDKDPRAFHRLQNQEYIMLIEGEGITIPDIKIVTSKPEKQP